MNNKPLVSIVINCHNCKSFLKPSLDSIISQTYVNWEVIFIDNQSTDSSTQIVKSYKEKRFKIYYTKEKKILGDARNLGLRYSRGKYISFLDADDIWDKDKLKNQVDDLSNSNYIVSYTSYNIINQHNKKVKEINLKYKNKIRSNDLLLNYDIILSSVMIIREVIEKNKVRFSNKYEVCEDIDFFLKLSLHGFFKKNYSLLTSYRVHSNNISRNNMSNFYYENKNMIENFIRISKIDINDYSLNFFKGKIYYYKIKYLKKDNIFKFSDALGLVKYFKVNKVFILIFLLSIMPKFFWNFYHKLNYKFY